MNVLPSINDCVDIGDLLYQVNRRVRWSDQLYTVDYQLDEEEQYYSATLDLHEISKKSIRIVENGTLREVRDSLIDILGGYYYE